MVSQLTIHTSDMDSDTIYLYVYLSRSTMVSQLTLPTPVIWMLVRLLETLTKMSQSNQPGIKSCFLGIFQWY